MITLFIIAVGCICLFIGYQLCLVRVEDDWHVRFEETPIHHIDANPDKIHHQKQAIHIRKYVKDKDSLSIELDTTIYTN